MTNNVSTPVSEGTHSHQPGLRRHCKCKCKLTPLALAGLLLCSALHAQGVVQTYNADHSASDPANKLLTIARTPNSLGPAERSELDASDPDGSLSTLLNQRHSGNTVTLKSGTVDGSVFGAAPTVSDTGVTENQTTVEGGEVKGDVFGGFTEEGNSPTSNNTAIINTNATIGGNVYGGYSSGSASVVSGNKSSIAGQAVVEKMPMAATAELPLQPQQATASLWAGRRISKAPYLAAIA